MAKSKIKLKPKAKDGVITIKALIKHPMETGLRKNKATGKNYPANYITDLSVKVNGKMVMNNLIGASISRNPYFQFRVKGNKGDSVELSFVDNIGKTDTITVKSR